LICENHECAIILNPHAKHDYVISHRDVVVAVAAGEMWLKAEAAWVLSEL